jgi:hypothetical protein
MLSDLETSVNSLEQGSKNMLTQAKLLAAKQTAKSWLPNSSLWEDRPNTRGSDSDNDKEDVSIPCRICIDTVQIQ